MVMVYNYLSHLFCNLVGGAHFPIDREARECWQKAAWSQTVMFRLLECSDCREDDKLTSVRGGEDNHGDMGFSDKWRIWLGLCWDGECDSVLRRLKLYLQRNCHFFGWIWLIIIVKTNYLDAWFLSCDYDVNHIMMHNVKAFSMVTPLPWHLPNLWLLLWWGSISGKKLCSVGSISCFILMKGLNTHGSTEKNFKHLMVLGDIWVCRSKIEDAFGYIWYLPLDKKLSLKALF